VSRSRWASSQLRRPHTREGLVSTNDRRNPGMFGHVENREFLREIQTAPLPERPATREGYITSPDRSPSSMSDRPPTREGLYPSAKGAGLEELPRPGDVPLKGKGSQRVSMAEGYQTPSETRMPALQMTSPTGSRLAPMSEDGITGDKLPQVAPRKSVAGEFLLTMQRQISPEGEEKPIQKSRTFRGRASVHLENLKRARSIQQEAAATRMDFQKRNTVQISDHIADESDEHNKKQEKVVRTITDAQGFEIQQVVKKDMRSTSFEAALGLARKHGIPLQEVRLALEEYRSLDEDGSDSLTMEEFEGAIRKRCGLGPDDPVPESLAVATHQQADSDGDGTVCFEEFLLWSRQCNFVEEIAVTSAEERHVRKIARDVGLTLIHVESLRDEFNSLDTDHSGFIEWEEFKQALCHMLDVKEATDISEAKVRRYWTEADVDGTGKLNFEAFVKWYGEKFYKPGEGGEETHFKFKKS